MCLQAEEVVILYRTKKSRCAQLQAAVTALMALLLCACAGGSSAPRGTTVTTMPGAADTVLPKRLVLAAGRDSPEYLLTAAESFCRRANSISDGIITLDFASAEDPLADFMDGKADMILLDGKSAEKLHAFFAIANEPFRYGSYEKFSITLNSAQVLRRLSEVLDARVFAAYYMGSDIFAGRAPLDDALNIGRGAEPESGRETGIFAAPGSGGWLARNFPDVAVTELYSPALRAEALAEPDTLAELPLDSALTARLAALLPDEDPDADGDENSGLVVTRSFHRVTAMWLIFAPALYEGLPPLGRAALDEAAAFMTGDVDNVCLGREQEFLNALEDEGITVTGGSTAVRAKISREESARMADMPAEEREFRELLDRFR